jgi:hypothetical protein
MRDENKTRLWSHQFIECFRSFMQSQTRTMSIKVSSRGSETRLGVNVPFDVALVSQKGVERLQTRFRFQVGETHLLEKERNFS